MRKLFPILLLLALVLPSGAATTTIVQATVTVTNAAGTTNGQTITVDGDVRTWTNAVFDASTQILTNSTVNGAAAALVQHVVAYPFTAVSAYLVSGTVIRLQGAPNANLVVTLSAGWGTVAMNTNIYTTGAVVVRVPYTDESIGNQTNIASGIAAAINSDHNTNGINAAKLYGSLTNNSETATYVTGGGSSLTNSITGNAATATLATNLPSGASITNVTHRGTIKRDHTYLYSTGAGGTNYIIDFGQGTTFTLLATNNVNLLHATNFTAESSEVAVYIYADGGTWTLAYNAEWKLIQTNAPTTVTSNQCAVLALGIKLPGGNTSQTNVVAACASYQ